MTTTNVTTNTDGTYKLIRAGDGKQFQFELDGSQLARYVIVGSAPSESLVGHRFREADKAKALKLPVGKDLYLKVPANSSATVVVTVGEA